MYLFLTRLNYKLSLAEDRYGGDIDYNSLNLLKNWIRIGIVFQNEYAAIYSNRKSNPIIRNYIKVKCSECNDYFFVKDLDINSFKNFYKRDRFNICREHLNFERVSKARYLSKDYINKVNELCKNNKDKNYKKIFLELDNDERRVLE